MIVLVGGEKGGVGKTTLAVNLAAMRRRAGHDVLLSTRTSKPARVCGPGFGRKNSARRPCPACKKEAKD